MQRCRYDVAYYPGRNYKSTCTHPTNIQPDPCKDWQRSSRWEYNYNGTGLVSLIIRIASGKVWSNVVYKAKPYNQNDRGIRESLNEGSESWQVGEEACKSQGSFAIRTSIQLGGCRGRALGRGIPGVEIFPGLLCRASCRVPRNTA